MSFLKDLTSFKSGNFVYKVVPGIPAIESGASACVFKVQSVGVVYALKAFKAGEHVKARREVDLLNKLFADNGGKQHMNLIEIVHHNLEGLHFLVMPWMDCSLSDYKIQNENVLKHIFDGIADGLAFMHENQIVHRDLKPDNVLMKGADAKIADFGFAAIVDARGVTDVDCDKTASYCPPERERENKGWNQINCFMYDIWQFGRVLEEMHKKVEEACDVPTILASMKDADPMKRPAAKDLKSKW